MESRKVPSKFCLPLIIFQLVIWNACNGASAKVEPMDYATEFRNQSVLINIIMWLLISIFSKICHAFNLQFSLFICLFCLHDFFGHLSLVSISSKRGGGDIA